MADENGAPETVKLTIDDHEVTVPKGTTLLHAAETIGVKVPHYCYHEGIPTAPAMCRMCLVEVEGAKKPQPSCVTQAQDGQVVHTQGETALGAREGVLEFYLKNHPLDCPICDMSGECKLQDYVHAEGRKHGRSREPKRVFGRDDFGGDVLYYGDRCVMCTRCVRFMNEVAQDPRLTVVDRANRSVIDTFFDEGVEGSPYAGNIVDICPVGALISKDFLHKARAWDLDHTPSVCPSCSQGCNIDLHTRDNVVQRLKPRLNPEVNGHWMCDYGRHRYEWMNRGDRIEVPLIRDEEGKARATGWGGAVASLVERLRGVSGEVRAVASADSSNEDLGAVRRLVEALGGGEVVYRSARSDEEVPLPGFPRLARRKDLAANVKGAEVLGFRRVGDEEGRGGLDEAASHPGVLLVVGDELADQDADFGREAELFVYLGANPSGAAAAADFVLPVSIFAEQEGTFTAHDGRVQRFWPGLQAPGAARPAWLVLGALTAELGGGEAPTTAARAFRELAEEVAAWSGITYETIGTRGARGREPAELTGD